MDKDEYYKISYVPGIRDELLKEGIYTFTFKDYLIVQITRKLDIMLLKSILKDHKLITLGTVELGIASFGPTEIF